MIYHVVAPVILKSASAPQASPAYWAASQHSVHIKHKRKRMSRTSSQADKTQSDNAQANNGQIHCTCGRCLAKENGIQCPRCKRPNSAIHFYPRSAIGGGSIEEDWRRHWKEAALVGCGICGIKPSGIKASDVQPESTGSHSLVSSLMRRPKELDPRGTDYPLPQFDLPDPTKLKGLKALMLLADGGELPEIIVPLQYLRARGAEVDVVGQNWIFEYREPAGMIVLAQWLADDYVIKAEKRMDDIDVSQYDLVIIPGGAWNPIMLSTDSDAVRLVRQAHKEGLLVASLCHGPQVLAHAAFDAPEGEENFPSQGVNITAAGDVRLFLRLAGFIVHSDQAAVYDQAANLLTSRDPNDLLEFCQEIGRLMSEQLPARLASRNAG